MSNKNDFNNTFERFFDLRETTSLHKSANGDMVNVNFRIPKTLRDEIERDLRDLADNGMKTSLNDYLLLLILCSGGFDQNDEHRFYHKGRGKKGDPAQNLITYFKDNKEAILKKVATKKK